MRFLKFTIALVVLILFGLGCAAFLMETVPPSKIGVKQNQWSGEGVIQEDFDTGFHLGIAGLHKWYLLDRRTHFLTYSDSRASRSYDQQEYSSLEIRTEDGNPTTIDVTVAYRIRPGEAHNLVAQGLSQVYRERVKETVQSVLREELAQLSSEDLYSSDMRLLRAEETLPILREALVDLYVEPQDILIRAVRFQSGYERRLQEKQLTYQKKLLATAQRKVEEQMQRTGTMEKEIEAAEKELTGEWNKKLQIARSNNEVAIAEILGDAEKYEKEITSNADADWETMIADGKLAIEKAEALRNELRNQALDTTGGSIYLAQQAAENLNIESVTLNSNDPSVPSVIDVPALVELLVGERSGD